MDNRAWKAFASNTPPPPEADPSSGYPTNGNPATGTPPTIPGAFWHHQIGEELRNVITLAGFDPTSASTTQVAEAIAHLIAESIPDAPPSASAATATANGASAGIVKLAASNNTTALNLAATPAGVAAQISNRMQVFTLGNVPATKTAGEVIYVVGYGYWEWVETAYFVGYRHPECGNRYDGDIHSATPNWLVDAVGGNMSKTTALGSRLFAAFAESGMLLLIENWGAGAHYIADNGDGTFRLPDLRNTFARAAAGAIDPDIANVRWIGSWQGDAIRNITGSYTPSGMNTSSTGRGFYGGSLSSEWSGALKQVNLSTTEYVLRGSDAKYQSARLDFDASLVVPTAWDNRPQNTAYYPRIHV